MSMDYEKKYKEALERAKEIIECSKNPGSKEVRMVLSFFPELKESKDENIRGKIITTIHLYYGEPLEDEAKEMIAWLEKKGEQKPAEFDDTNAKRMFIKALERVEEQNNKGYKLTDCDKNSWWEDFKAYTSCIVEQKPWSEEDERLRTSCIKHIEEELERIRNDKYGHSEIISDLKESCRERINWLESLKDRVQRKQEWSEEDKAILEKCIGAVKVSCYSYSFKSEAENWLKSLRPQNWTKEDKERYISCLQRLGTGDPKQPETINSKWFKEHVYPRSTWKPTEQQMKVLNVVINFAADHGTMRWNDFIYNVLKGLREQLKKL